jgi:hypothetical protein
MTDAAEPSDRRFAAHPWVRTRMGDDRASSPSTWNTRAYWKAVSRASQLSREGRDADVTRGRVMAAHARIQSADRAG